MKATEILLQQLFGSDWTLEHEGNVVFGRGRLNDRDLRIIGTVNQCEIGIDEATRLAGAVLDVLAEAEPGSKPADILFLVDNSGQRLSLRDELLGNVAALAHLAEVLHLARREGARVLGLVHRLALSGGFMATGMAATRCDALAEAEVRVMRLDAMSRIMKVPKDRLTELVEGTAILGPGVRNYHAIGALTELWESPTSDRLEAAFDAMSQANSDDTRGDMGRARGGRTLAACVAELVRQA